MSAARARHTAGSADTSVAVKLFAVGAANTESVMRHISRPSSE